MASDVEALLAELLTSDEEEEELPSSLPSQPAVLDELEGKEPSHSSHGTGAVKAPAAEAPAAAAAAARAGRPSLEGRHPGDAAGGPQQQQEGGSHSFGPNEAAGGAGDDTEAVSALPPQPPPQAAAPAPLPALRGEGSSAPSPVLAAEPTAPDLPGSGLEPQEAGHSAGPKGREGGLEEEEAGLSDIETEEGPHGSASEEVAGSGLSEVATEASEGEEELEVTRAAWEQGLGRQPAAAAAAAPTIQGLGLAAEPSAGRQQQQEGVSQSEGEPVPAQQAQQEGVSQSGGEPVPAQQAQQEGVSQSGGEPVPAQQAQQEGVSQSGGEPLPAQQAQQEEAAFAQQAAPEEQQSLLRAAEELEWRLAAGAEAAPAEAGAALEKAAYQQDLLVASLVSQLEARERGAPAQEGLTDERGTVAGRLAVARAFLSPSFEPLFRGPQSHGMPSVVTKYRGMVAVGTSSGSIHVLMPLGKKEQQGQSRLMELGEKQSSGAAAATGAGSSGGDGVTALCFGQHGGTLLMLSGHSSGALKVWELKTHLTGGVNWALAKALGGVHGTDVTACILLEGGPTTWALSSDAHGRLMAHNLSKHLSVAAQALTSFARQLTGAGSIPSHLISLQAAGQDPGIVLGIAPLHAQHRAAGATPDQAAELGAFVFVPELGHLVLLCAARAILLCLLSQEGRMHVLHVFLPPLNTPADCSPYAAWHMEMSPQQGAAVGAVVTVAWQASVSVYRTVLLWRRPAPQARRQSLQAEAQERPGPLPTPALLNTWALRGPVCGVGFLDGGALVVAAGLGETATEVLVYAKDQYGSSTHKLSQLLPAAGTGGNGGEKQAAGQSPAQTSGAGAVERLVIRDWVVGAQVLAVAGSTFHSSMSGFGEQMLLLTSQGVRVLQLMTWQQRLSALIAQRRMERALHEAIAIFHRASHPAAGTGRWPADGAGANPLEVSRQLLTILCGLVDNDLVALSSGQGGQQQEQEGAPSPQWLAEVSIDACLLLRRPEALLSDVFPRWQPTSFLGAFLQQLEPHILRDELPSLAPEVMQALVEHFVSIGHPERVERCVLKMDIMSLDLNQLIPLCLRHHLYSALLHIFTGAMLDYQTPASLLLVAAAAEMDREDVTATASPAAQQAQQAQQGAMHAAAGAAAPPATAAAELLAQHKGLRLAYKLLVFLQCCLMAQKYPPGSGSIPQAQQHAVKLQAVAFLLYANALSVWECWRLWSEAAHADADAQALHELPLGIADPHPALRLLCHVDAPATLGLLRRALHDWDAVEADLSEVVPSVAQQLLGGGHRTMTQAIIDAVVHLLQSRAFDDLSNGGAGAGGAGSSSSRRSSSAGAAETTALQFVADHLASNRAVVPPSIVMHILSHLAAPAGQPQHAQQAQQAEGVFRDVITHAASALSEVDRQEVVWLARRAGFLQAEARMRELEGAHGEALACLTKDRRHPGAPFKFVRDLLGDAFVTQPTREALQASVMQQMAALMELDATAAAQLVLDCFPDQQQAVLAGLAPTPRLQFLFLQSLVHLQQRGATAAAGAAVATAGGGERLREPWAGGPSSSLKASSRDPRLRPLLSDMAVSNLFVELLCRFEPAAVLPFLQGHDTYGVDDCLRACLQHRVQDGAAFLLERRGDVHSALKIYIQALDTSNRALVATVKAGGGQADAWLEEEASPRGASPQPLGAWPRQLSPLWAPGRGWLLSGLSPRSSQGLALLPELQAAQEALRNAIAVCIRYSQDRLGGGADAALASAAGLDLLAGEGDFAADPVQRLWFQVLQGYVVMIRELRKEEHALEKAQEGGAPAEGVGAAGLEGAAAGGPADEERQRQRLLLLQHIFTGFMEEVIRGMAGHVPLKSVAEAIINQYGADQFGDFKSTLLGLLGACNSELSILRCANRVMGSDGARILAGGYRECSRPAVNL